MCYSGHRPHCKRRLYKQSATVVQNSRNLDSRSLHLGAQRARAHAIRHPTPLRLALAEHDTAGGKCRDYGSRPDVLNDAKDAKKWPEYPMQSLQLIKRRLLRHPTPQRCHVR